MRILCSSLVACLCITFIHLGNAWRRELLQYTGFLGLLAAGGLLVAWSITVWKARETSSAQRRVALTILALYVASCLTPTVHVDGGGQPNSDLDFRIGSPEKTHY
jgi:hypothetical protein